MSKKVKLALFVTFFAVLALVYIGQIAERLDAHAAIESVRGIEKVTTSGNLSLGVILIWFVAIVAIFTRPRRGSFLLVLVLFAGSISSACSGSVKYATTNPRDVVFVINLERVAEQLRTANQTRPQPTPLAEETQEAGRQDPTAAIGDQTNPAFWEANRQPINIQRIEIPSTSKRVGDGLLGSEVGANRAAFDSIMVVTVPTTPVKVEWIAPAIQCNADGSQGPLPDMSGAFSMQSLEEEGGSTGVYTGAVVNASISDPAVYLSVYGYEAEDPNTHTHSAKPLEVVIQGEMRGFIQQRLAFEYGQRSVLQQNRDLNEMFSNTFDALNETYKPKGITITSFYDRDGNVYENCAIQAQADQQLERQNAYQQAYATATLAAIANNAQVEQAYAQATATMISAQSAAQAQQLQAQALRENPDLVSLEFARRWNGQLPQIMGDSSAVPMIPFSLAPSAPEPVPTQAPAQ